MTSIWTKDRAASGSPAEKAAAPPGAYSALNLVVLPPPDDRRSAQILATYSNARVLEQFPTRDSHAAGAGKRWQQIIDCHERIERYINGRAGYELPSDAEVLEFGGMLFETLFPEGVRRIYDVARSSYRGARLPVVLTSMIPWIAEKPWEFAYDAARNVFLATEEIHFIRNVLTAIPAEQVAPSERRLRILVVVAQPVGAGNLSSDQEVTVIRRGFEPLVEAGLAEVTVLPKATPRKLHGAVGREQYDIVHCICHGDYDEKNQRGYLLFESGSGGEHVIDERVVRELLCNRGIRLVFLNACETGRGGRANFNSGVAQSLVAGGIPAVVANQYKVLDLSATAFSQHFYWCLAVGMSIGEAAREARISIRYALSSEPIDWAVPVVYSRNSETRLCQRREPQPAELAALAMAGKSAPAVSREPESRRLSVAVWDISHAFPGLEDTLAKMNRSQDRFRFEVASLALPLSARISLEGCDHPFLYCDAVAERMAVWPQELGFDQLACLTTEPMACLSEPARRGEEDEYLAYVYAWADETGASPISIFSAYDLDIPPGGLESTRAIVNALVYSIAARLGHLEPHRRGPKSCLFYDNQQRDIEQITGRLQFDEQCRDHLMAEIPDDLPALEALLQVE